MSAHRAIRTILYTLLIFTPLARGSVQGWAVCLIHMTTLLALTIFLIDKTWRWEWKWIATPLDKPILALAVLAILSAIFSEHRYGSVWALALFFNYIVLLYLTVHTIRTRSQFRTLVYVIMGTGAFLALFGLFKMTGNSLFSWWHYTDIPQSAHRLSSTYGNPDHLAGYMEMAIPLILGFFLSGLIFEKRLFFSVLTILLMTALLLSLSRGGWIGLAAALVFMLATYLNSQYSKYSKLIIASTIVFIIMSLISLSSTDVVTRALTFEQGTEMPSLAGRVTVWGGIVDMIRAYPLLGSGPGTFATVFTQFQPAGVMGYYTMGHNDYLHFIAELGLPLIAILIWMLAIFYKRGFQKLKHPSRLISGITLGSMGSVTAILVHSVGDFNLHIPGNAVVFIIISVFIIGPNPSMSVRKTLTVKQTQKALKIC